MELTSLLASPSTDSKSPVRRYQVSQLETESETSSRSLCRVCFAADEPQALIRPCDCKGSVAYIHTSCLYQWVSTTAKTVCEICKQPYEMVSDGLKPFKLWKWPHALDNTWEDEIDFRCAIIWAFFMMKLVLIVIKYGISELPNVVGSIMGASTIWYKLWWLSFVLNAIYYSTIIALVYEQWRIENSQFKFKNRDDEETMTARTTSRISAKLNRMKG